MKTKELIRRLQEEDPSGELEVNVGNSDIHFVECQPAYYDGRGQVLIRDEGNPYYNIIGGKFIVGGNKVRIHTLSIRDAIDNNPDLPVDFSEMEKMMPSSLDDYKEAVEQWREEARLSIKEVEEWAAERERKAQEGK